jgi:hypothetical protein
MNPLRNESELSVAELKDSQALYCVRSPSPAWRRAAVGRPPAMIVMAPRSVYQATSVGAEGHSRVVPPRVSPRGRDDQGLVWQTARRRPRVGGRRLGLLWVRG